MGLASGASADVLATYIDGLEYADAPNTPPASVAADLSASLMSFEGLSGGLSGSVRDSFGVIFSGTYKLVSNAATDLASDPGSGADGAANDYWGFTVTMGAGKQLDLSSLTFDWLIGMNNATPALTGATFGYRVFASVNGGAFASIDLASVTTHVPQGPGIAQPSANIDLTSFATITGGSVEFRVVQFSSSNSSGAINAYDNIVLNGTISAAADTDNDGMADVWEEANGLIVGIDDSALDADSDGGPDGLTNIEEFQRGTDPQDSDTDDDDLKDGVETDTGTYVSPSDTGTDPLNEDTDGDNYPDGHEVTKSSDPTDSNSVPPPPAGIAEVAPNGAWTWFNDERAIFHQGYLFSGYVLSDGRYGVTRYDPATGTANHMIISTTSSQQQDDHNNPSLTVLPDGRLLAVYSKHGSNHYFFHRTSKVETPSSSADWNAEQTEATPALTTYANTYRLSEESDRIYNFHRCINWNPTITRSSDNGATWETPVHFIKQLVSQRPYPRYCSNHSNRVDLIYTDGHPRNIANSIYHLYYQGGNFNKTDGTLVKSFANLPLEHNSGERGSVVYPYSTAAWGAGEGPDDWIPSGRAWTWDICYGTDGHPVCVFQVQLDTSSSRDDSRIYYYYARWTGTKWQRRFIAQAGRGLYDYENDYGGGMTIDPEDPRVVYIASNAANPFELGDIDIGNVPLGPNERYEIWRGFTADGGLTFTWQPVTTNSFTDNLRPIVPENHGRARHVLWFSGTYPTFRTFSTRVLGVFDDPKEDFADWQSGFGIGGGAFDDDSDGDGLEDLLEYALGGDPTDPLDHPFPTISSDRFSFHHLPPRTDVEWIMETAPDLLGAWIEIATVRAAGLPNDIAAGYALGTDGGDPALLTLEPTEASPQGFYRLKVRYGN